MPKFILAILLFLQAAPMAAQTYAGKWEGGGFYPPGQSMTTMMQKMGAIKKVDLEINTSGAIKGTLAVIYDKSKATLITNVTEQYFTISGKLDATKQILLLTVTHSQKDRNSTNTDIHFTKPDSIYYSIKIPAQNKRPVITGTADKKLNRNTTDEWIGSAKGTGMGMNISDNINMHLLPINIRLVNTDMHPSENAGDSLTDKRPNLLQTALNNITPRKTVIQRTIVLDTGFIRLDMYDNGEIDGDIATLILDGKPIIENHLLSTTAASISLSLDKQKREHLLELFANNLGSIPPNTALVVLTCNKKRYEIFLSSNDTENGSVKLILK